MTELERLRELLDKTEDELYEERGLIEKLKVENEQLKKKNEELKFALNRVYGCDSLYPCNVVMGGRAQGKTLFLKEFYTRYIEKTKVIIEAFPFLRDQLAPNIEQAEKIIKELNERFTYHDSDPEYKNLTEPSEDLQKRGEYLQ